ncbi:GntR family transcriptional regulator [Pseudonocardia sp. HH130630-07]|uniref:GntR family transcriptional regulator n=1 Tax=Pseudonocardia sp. HH130630-07 TaxID=1690815 RepID=UPI000814F055|nr:GntR family transcriptional regulator [Pseudonocardia sp. HH130630-07]ANY07613.1 GntR family transcriptional regulator [Pseudonocardia sp. HH130630-07]
MTRSDRPEPPYLRVVRRIRDDVLSGRLAEGDLVPSARQIAADWEIALATATKALATLRAEGLVRGVPGIGTVVTGSTTTHSPQERGSSFRRTGRIYPPGQRARIVAADFTTASDQVASALGVDAGSGVIRRRRTTLDGSGTPLSTSTSWFDGSLAGRCPALLVAERIPQGTARYVEERTGRVVISGRDQLAAGTATAEDAAELGVAPGSVVLLRRNRWLDADGDVVEYGESASPPGRWTTYEYVLGE